MTEAEIGRLLADIEEYSKRQRPETAAALRLAPLLMVRPMELCAARWSEIDLEGAEWLLPASRMKMGREHIVPLPRQAMEIIGELRMLTDGLEWLFPAYSRKGFTFAKEFYDLCPDD